MLDIIITIVTDHAVLLIAILSLVVSLRSNSIAAKAKQFTEQSLRDARRVEVFRKRTEILAEIDRQHARFGTLLAIIAEKSVLYQQNPVIAKRNLSEISRLTKSMKAIQQLMDRYKKQRSVSERIGEGADLAQHEVGLAEIRRLTIHVDEDISKELMGLEDVRKLLG